MDCWLESSDERTAEVAAAVVAAASDVACEPTVTPPACINAPVRPKRAAVEPAATAMRERPATCRRRVRRGVEAEVVEWLRFVMTST